VRGFSLPTSLWDLLWKGFCDLSCHLSEEHRRRCDERWALKGRTLWVVRRKNPDDHKLGLFACPGQAQRHVWRLADQGIETFPPYAQVVDVEEPGCQ